MLVNKVDLIPHLDFDIDTFCTNLRAVNPAATVVETSARIGVELNAWSDWLLSMRAAGRICTGDRDLMR